MRPAAWMFALATCCAASIANAQEKVEFASLDTGGVTLQAHWYATSATPRAPAVVLLHGCSGMYGRNGQVSQRLRDYAALFNQHGVHALIVDSLTPRGEKEICTQRLRSRKVTMANRRLDTLAAMQWLARRTEVDAGRIGLVGWSNGGSTVLAATNRQHREVEASEVVPAFAVAFYPGCAAELAAGYRPSAPLLLLVGEADDWTPAGPCVTLAGRPANPQPVIEVYAGAHHGFDANVPLRLRADVPGGANPGQGVHVGGQPEARRLSHQRLLEFLEAHRR